MIVIVHLGLNLVVNVIVVVNELQVLIVFVNIFVYLNVIVNSNPVNVNRNVDLNFLNLVSPLQLWVINQGKRREKVVVVDQNHQYQKQKVMTCRREHQVPFPDPNV